MSAARVEAGHPRRAHQELRVLARNAALALEDAPAAEVVRWAADTFGSRLAVTSSMADAVVVDIASRVAPGIEVVFLDTGYHFAETIGTRDAVGAVYDITLRSVRPDATVEEQDARHGPRLHERDPDLCCALRKVAPLERALADHDAWITGLRRDESPTRAGTPVVAFDEARGKVKVSPIATWTEQQVQDYVQANGVLVNPLLTDGYSSVGCAPCTLRSAHGRAGRWGGLSKTECGIHQ